MLKKFKFLAHDWVRSSQAKAKIPVSQFARIRAWTTYGMTVSEVAEVYGVADGEIERILRRA
jgi:hypothetical protein